MTTLSASNNIENSNGLNLSRLNLNNQTLNSRFNNRSKFYCKSYAFTLLMFSLLTTLPSYSVANGLNLDTNKVAEATQNKMDHNDINMTGVWCGQWDGIYKTCLTIKATHQGFTAYYQWQEHKNGGYHKKQLQGKKLNVNTINFEGKLFAINLQNHNNATAFGIFKQHTRVASLSRQLEDSSTSN